MDKDTWLSGNSKTGGFQLKEYCVSEKFPWLVDGLYITVPEDSLFLHAHLLLQPLRDKFGVPIIINRGYADWKLNAAQDGSPNSRHMLGKAADITTKNKRLLEDMFDWAEKNLPVGELILYWYESEPLFIHIALPKHGADNNRIIRNKQYRG